MGPSVFNQGWLNFGGGRVQIGSMERLDLIPAEEVPVYDPEMNGIVSGTEDNKLLVTSTTGGLTIAVDPNQGVDIFSAYPYSMKKCRNPSGR
ncbi:MAG: hypothetical protein JXA25_19960 [Anaerolineales bacterium]|nr:hypothetical protein [Anaerolineales bacterium]